MSAVSVRVVVNPVAARREAARGVNGVKTVRTIFVSANDTGVGKTRVTAALARHLLKTGASVQIVKAVETGVAPAAPMSASAAVVSLSAATATVATAACAGGDAAFAMAFALRGADATELERASARISAYTLQCFAAPLSPLDAAALEGKVFDLDALVAATLALPVADWRLVEGAGGLAVPLERGAQARDWADFSLAIAADANVLVVGNRLGAINQARLLAAYAHQRGLGACSGLWLNQAQEELPAAVAASNRAALADGGAGLPLWAQQDFNQAWPQRVEAAWLQ